ncbi:tRNA threonylcarbamoyladenosine dehydratase [Chitinimonas sp. BJB300]|uniref:tRNA threonylcarbamoyladenosine dehydratase n=1 Tax=Chitinimonas sp. BJB300 TaxID=1559339 RepID=UPI000C10BF0E|nr:tRNA threonylcarbamoyladenosine dehydratase [Chitinimonas sp. BJB300]PHV10211.1 tRNA threonylcarbamoyladenosine dehydratase [Chitinimonas sp. BJB300]TSJ91102.1 tRNA threonylcarbamoyladenosine dehydratase [Chitinimonas sp. BJB300]
MDTQDDLNYSRRFGGIARLYGASALTRFEAAHICIIGVGGVGSWAAEAIARSAVGQISLIDMDHVAVSNVNRQLHAVDGNLGKAKVTAMAERIHAINPRAVVNEIDDFLTADNLADLMPRGRFDYVIDCIDQMRVKVALVVHCKRNKVPLIVSGGAGGRIDPTRIAVADIAHTSGDALLSKIRAELRRNHGFAREGKKFGIEAVYSTEPIVRPVVDACEPVIGTPQGLNCAGYGSAVAVTASFGMAAAGRVLAQLAKKPS